MSSRPTTPAKSLSPTRSHTPAPRSHTPGPDQSAAAAVLLRSHTPAPPMPRRSHTASLPRSQTYTPAPPPVPPMPSPPIKSSTRPPANFEPDHEWKRQLKEKIEESFKSMIQEAKDNQKAQLLQGIVSQERLEVEYKQAVNIIKGLAEEQYQLACMKERNELRWNDFLYKEQQNIMNAIKQSNHSDNPVRAAESPTDKWGTNGSTSSSPSAASTPRHESESQSADPFPTREAPTHDRAWSRTLISLSSTTASQDDPPLPPVPRYLISSRHETPSMEELMRREKLFNLMQAQFRKRAEEIKRTRAEERKHPDCGPVLGSERWDWLRKKEEQDELSSTSEEESEDNRGNGDGEEDDNVVDVRARVLEAEFVLEAELQRIDRERREADTTIREQVLELQRLEDETRRMEEEAELLEARHAAERLAHEARTKEEEMKIKEKQLEKREVYVMRKAADADMLKEEAAMKAKEIKKMEAEVKVREAELKKKKEQLKEDELRNQELRRQAQQIAHETGKAKETVRKLEDSETPRTFARSGYSGYPPSGEYLATKLVDNASDRTVILREVVEPIETGFPAAWTRNSIGPRRPLDLSSATFEIAHEPEHGPEPSTPPNANQVVQLPSQNSQRGTAPWIAASRKLQVPRKPMDTQFKLHMAGRRRQIDGASLSSASSTPRASFIGPRHSIGSSIFSTSLSIESLSADVLSAEVECPPTPVFTDEIPRGLTPIAESSFSATQAPKRSAPKNSYPLQNPHFNSASSLNFNLAPRTPTPTGSIRRGYWNRRGDHLTPDGYVVFPPPRMQYPEELRAYPFENQGYQDHNGLFIAYVRRAEHPQSLSKHGKPPERSYESFVTYV